MPSDPRQDAIKALGEALHAVDDDVQFIRRDARNLPVLAGRLVNALDAHPKAKAALAAWLGLPTCAICHRVKSNGYHKRVGRTWEPPQHPFRGLAASETPDTTGLRPDG